jgi:hypothetical protein
VTKASETISKLMRGTKPSDSKPTEGTAYYLRQNGRALNKRQTVTLPRVSIQSKSEDEGQKP